MLVGFAHVRVPGCLVYFLSVGVAGERVTSLSNVLGKKHGFSCKRGNQSTDF